MMRSILRTIATIRLLAVTACGGAAMTITEAENGQTITVAKGGTLTVTLASNPTTGFQWTVDQPDPSKLKQVGEPAYTSDCPDGRSGCGGHQTFAFTATGSGQTVLRLIYHRTFEQGKPPAQSFEVIVNIQ